MGRAENLVAVSKRIAVAIDKNARVGQENGAGEGKPKVFISN